MEKPDPITMTPKEVADILGVHRSTVNRYVRKNELPLITVAGRKFISRAGMERIFAKRKKA